MNAGRFEEIEAVAAQLFAKGEFVPAAMLRELLAALAQAQQIIADVPTSNIILLAEAGVRPDDSWLVRSWAHPFFDIQLDLPQLGSL